MKTTRSLEISVEREEVVLMRRSANRAALWCTACDNEVEMITPEEAMVISGASWHEMVRRVQSHDVHSTETPDGKLLICINSI